MNLLRWKWMALPMGTWASTAISASNRPRPWALDDKYLLLVIRQALANLRHAFRYFSRGRPDVVLTSYTTYIRHGIPARVAAKLGIRVLAFGNNQELSTEINADKLFHTKDGCALQGDSFQALPDKASAAAAAERILDARLRGIIDKNTGYMKTSAYNEENIQEFDASGMPIVFLHDFFDSVHIYRWIVFHDFWTWACFTIDTLRAAGIRFAVKPHPNQVSDSGDVMKQLQEKYPDLAVVPPGISNRQLVRSGMACAITVYGTVASEMAFMGIPTISCGDNPHVSFDFCHTARSPTEYADLLRNCRDAGRQSRCNGKAKSCAFYYMHALNGSERGPDTV